MMADNYKILAQDTAKSLSLVPATSPETGFVNQANILYTVPENTQASISSISLVNTAEENVEYSLGVVKAEDAASSEEVFGSVARVTVTGDQGDSRSYSSTDGISWQPTSINEGEYRISSGSFGNGIFLVSAFTNSATFYGLGLSSDGVNYTFTAFPEIFEDIASNGFQMFTGAVSFDGTKFFLTIPVYDVSQPSGSQYTYPTYTSEDGVSWTFFEVDGLSFNAGAPSFIHVSEIPLLSANFAESGAHPLDYGLAAFNAEESSWSRVSLPAGFWTPWLIAKQNQTYILLNGDASNSYLTSTDLVTWTVRSFPYPQIPNFYATVVESYGPYIYVSGYNAPTVLRSSNVSDPSAWENLESQIPSVSFSYDWLDFFSFEEKVFVKYQSTWPNNNIYAYSSNYGNTWTLSQFPDNIRTGSYLTKSDTRSTVLSLSAAQTIIPTRSIEPNVVDEVVGGITLSEGDQIRIYSESPDLIAQVYGVEIE
jgi:hypothetical protein